MTAPDGIVTLINCGCVTTHVTGKTGATDVAGCITGETRVTTWSLVITFVSISRHF